MMQLYAAYARESNFAQATAIKIKIHKQTWRTSYGICSQRPTLMLNGPITSVIFHEDVKPDHLSTCRKYKNWWHPEMLLSIASGAA